MKTFVLLITPFSLFAQISSFPAGNVNAAPAKLSSGVIVLALTACPQGYSEVAALNGRTLIGTLSINNDVGATGGSDTITPAGIVSQPTFSGNALAGHAHTFTGSLLTTHTHAVGTYVATAPTFTGSALATHSHGVGTYVNATAVFTPAHLRDP